MTAVVEHIPGEPIIGAARAKPSMLASFARPGFARIYFAAFGFGMARWGLGFLAAFVANDLTSSPRAVQLTGTALWLPLLFAGTAAGVLADRFDRRIMLTTVVVMLTPLVLAAGVLATRGSLRVWMLYPLMLFVGISWVVDLTSRRTLVFDIVGPDLIDNAMALESFSTALALALGVTAGGAAVEILGVGSAFIAVAGLLTVSSFLFWAATRHATPGSERPSTELPANAEAAPEPGSEDGRSGLAAVVKSPMLRSVLGVTVLANMFFFSHTPLVPVFAERLGVGALGAGLLASAGGLGMMVAAVGIARLRPPRGKTYVAGAAIALLALNGLGLFNEAPMVFAALLLASTGFGLFAATQAAATMTSVEVGLQGRAMGLLSTAIGALPIGMFTLGEVAERIGPDNAVNLYAAIGIVSLAGWVWRRPEVLDAR